MNPLKRLLELTFPRLALFVMLVTLSMHWPHVYIVAFTLKPFHFCEALVLIAALIMPAGFVWVRRSERIYVLSFLALLVCWTVSAFCAEVSTMRALTLVSAAIHLMISAWATYRLAAERRPTDLLAIL